MKAVLERAAFDEVLVDNRAFVDSAKSGLIVKAFDLFVDVVKINLSREIFRKVVSTFFGDFKKIP